MCVSVVWVVVGWLSGCSRVGCIKAVGCIPVPRQVGGAVGPQPRQQRVVGVVENLLGVTLSLEVTEQ